GNHRRRPCALLTCLSQRPCRNRSHEQERATDRDAAPKGQRASFLRGPTPGSAGNGRGAACLARVWFLLNLNNPVPRQRPRLRWRRGGFSLPRGTAWLLVGLGHGDVFLRNLDDLIAQGRPGALRPDRAWNLHTRTSIETRNGSLRDFLIPNRVDLFSSAAEIAAVSAGLDGNESPQPGISPLCQKPVKCCDLPDNYNPEVGRALAVPRMKLADEAGGTRGGGKVIQDKPL